MSQFDNAMKGRKQYKIAEKILRVSNKDNHRGKEKAEEKRVHDEGNINVACVGFSYQNIWEEKGKKKIQNYSNQEQTLEYRLGQN